MSTAAWLALAAAAVLATILAVVSAALAALEALPRGQTQPTGGAASRRAAALSDLLARRERVLRGLAAAGHLSAAAAAVLAVGALSPLFVGRGVVGVFAVLAAVVAVAGLVAIPRALAQRDPERMAIAVAPVAQIVSAAVVLPVMLAETLARIVLAVAGRRPSTEAAMLSGHEELRGAVDLLHREGAVVKSDRDMVGGVLDLSKLTVADVMVHRTAMRSLDAEEPAADLVRQVLESSYTRIPLWRDEPDNIIGIVHAKDVLRAIQRSRGTAEAIDLAEIASDPWFVPDTTRLDDQLKAFLKRKIHLALVVDEYGEVQGLVTLEDILEEIVGDIADEQDVVVQGVRPQADGSVNVSGSVPIRDLNRAMDWHLPDDEAITVAGLVIHEARVIPDAGQAFTFHGFRFQVLRRRRHRITALRITPLPSGPARPAS